jgi:hypothetical protein
VESWTGKDLDNDRSIGNPALQFAVVNPGAASVTVVQSEPDSLKTAQNCNFGTGQTELESPAAGLDGSTGIEALVSEP